MNAATITAAVNGGVVLEESIIPPNKTKPSIPFGQLNTKLVTGNVGADVSSGEDNTIGL
jgi:hypothetical protein